MFIIIGWVVVLGSVLGGFSLMGGHIAALYQPFELLVIGGSGMGAFIVANPKFILARIG